MKIIYGMVMLLGSFSVYAGNNEDITTSQITASKNVGQSQQVQERQASDFSDNTIRFSGGVTEGTCVNTLNATHCSGAHPPIRTVKDYSFGSIVTLTYL